MNFEQINNIIVNVLSNSFIVGNYQLKKVDKYRKLFGIEKVKEKEKILKEKSIKRKERSIEDEEIKEKLDEFIKILKENFSSESLKNFYDNIKWLKIEIFNSFKDFECYGIYNASRNLLFVKKDNINNALFHELFHLASAKPNLKYERVGFLLNYKKDCIGYGLNEGYTELLTNRYFNNESDSYILEKSVASHLELIVGKDKMQSLYMNADLFGLVGELNKYYTTNEIEKFLLNLDVYTCYYQERNIVSTKLENKVSELIEEINLFLVKGYLNLLKETTINKQYIIDFIKGIYCFKENSDLIEKINDLIYNILGQEYLISDGEIILEEKGAKSK